MVAGVLDTAASTGEQQQTQQSKCQIQKRHSGVNSGVHRLKQKHQLMHHLCYPVLNNYMNKCCIISYSYSHGLHKNNCHTESEEILDKRHSLSALPADT